MTINRDEVPTVAEQVSSLENGYADLLLENKALGESIQLLTKQVHELEDQQAITRQAFQNLLHEKDTTIAGLDAIVQEKLVEIKSCHDTIRSSNETIKAKDGVIKYNMGVIDTLNDKIVELNMATQAKDKAIEQLRECNDRLDHRLELMGRHTATSVRIEGDKDRDNPLSAGPWSSDQSKAYNSSTCDCDHPGPFDSRNYCVKCGRKYNAPNPGLKFGEIQLAKRIYHNIHYPAIRALLGYETCRILDIVLDLDQPGVSD
jgi:hypothetical protein